jgi:hypothetical protein
MSKSNLILLAGTTALLAACASPPPVKPANSSLSLTRSCGRSRASKARSAGSKRWRPLALGITALGGALIAQALGPVVTWNHTESLAEGLYVRSMASPGSAPSWRSQPQRWR